MHMQRVDANEEITVASHMKDHQAPGKGKGDMKKGHATRLQQAIAFEENDADLLMTTTNPRVRQGLHRHTVPARPALCACVGLA
jgi:hypothetical protein